VGIAQLAEHRTVAPTVAGSIPVSHPNSFSAFSGDPGSAVPPMRVLRPSTAIAAAALLFAMPSRAADGRFDQTLRASTPFKLEIVNDVGEISVRAGSTNKIEIHAKLHSIDNSEDDADVAKRIHAIEMNPPIQSDARGRSVHIGPIADPDAVRNISISYEIVVPIATQLHSETGTGDQSIEGIQGPVDASSGSGKLRVWHIAKDTHVSTGSGDLDLHDLHGNIQAKAGTGTVYATDIAGNEMPREGQVQISDPKNGIPITVQTAIGAVGLQIVTGSGDVDVENLEGGLNVTSGSGNIRASGRPNSDWQLDTGTGTVRVQFPADANLALVAHTSSGVIEGAEALTVQGKKNPRDLRAQIGKGGPTVELKTASGNIEIK
jgi:DUF4097 and DUF4098 domain-containing protein YvlB